VFFDQKNVLFVNYSGKNILYITLNEILYVLYGMNNFLIIFVLYLNRGFLTSPNNS
jgi:hypothetical protein